jgi:hypothetical protein
MTLFGLADLRSSGLTSAEQAAWGNLTMIAKNNDYMLQHTFEASSNSSGPSGDQNGGPSGGSSSDPSGGDSSSGPLSYAKYIMPVSSKMVFTNWQGKQIGCLQLDVTCPQCGSSGFP